VKESNDGPWTHGTIRANGLSFHAVTMGDGPPVLLLHGFPENWYSWRHQLPALAAAGHRAVAVDLRGYGGTDRPRGVAAYHIDRLVADVDGLIDALGGPLGGRVHLVGHDWGGALAWIYAARRGERLRTLTVMNAPHPRAFFRELRRNPKQRRRSWYFAFFQVPWLPEFLIRRGANTIFAKAFGGAARRKEMFPDEVIAAFRDPMMEPGALTAAINYYRALARDPRNLRDARNFPAIAVPTLLIWAMNDAALGPELADGLEPWFTGGLAIDRVPGCSHWVQQEEPERVNARLAGFLREAGARAG
jgi:pimeloyl-ACP methyl ester carboxylesterase